MTLLVDSSKTGYIFNRKIDGDISSSQILESRRKKNPEESLHKRLLLGEASPDRIRSSVPRAAVDRLLVLTSHTCS
jgi:hypothetical protein